MIGHGYYPIVLPYKILLWLLSSFSHCKHIAAKKTYNIGLTLLVDLQQCREKSREPVISDRWGNLRLAIGLLAGSQCLDEPMTNNIFQQCSQGMRGV